MRQVRTSSSDKGKPPTKTMKPASTSQANGYAGSGKTILSRTKITTNSGSPAIRLARLYIAYGLDASSGSQYSMISACPGFIHSRFERSVMPSEPAGRLFQKTPYRCNFMRLYGVGFALQTAYASRSSLVFQSVHDYLNPCFLKN